MTRLSMGIFCSAANTPCALLSKGMLPEATPLEICTSDKINRVHTIIVEKIILKNEINSKNTLVEQLRYVLVIEHE